MADVRNCRKRYVSSYTLIVSENCVSIDLEIVNEYKVTADVWNR
jgi:hypothetical protein